MTLENVQDIYPLSPVQTGMLFHAIEASEPGLYVLQLRLTLEGPLRHDVLRDAWGEVVQRHDALRAAFLWEGLEEPLQVIRERIETPWTRQGARELEEARGSGGEAAWLAADRAKGFDLGQAPLMRVALLELGPRRHRLVWTLHHLLADAWSMAVFLRELHTVYHARAAGDAPALDPAPAYGDFIAWLRDRDDARARDIWRRYLEGVSQPPPLRLPPPAKPPSPGGRRQVEQVLTPGCAAALDPLARDRQVTPAALYYSAWALVLSRYTGTDEIMFGTVLSGRGHGLPGAERAVGLYINTVPIRVRISGERTRGALIDRVHADLVALRRAEHAPLGRIQAWSDAGAGTPLFDTMLVIENHPPLDSDGGELAFRDFDPRDQSHYGLSVFVVPGERPKLLALFDPARLDSATAGRLLGQFATALEALAAEPEGAPRDLPVLPEAEREALERLAHGAPPEPPDDLLAPIARAARDHPDRTALVCGQATLSYGELVTRAARCAAALEEQGLGPGQRVALVLERGCGMVVAMLGVLRAGAAYVPVDTNYPAERIRAVLDDCAPGAVITDGTPAPSAPTSAPVLRLSDLTAAGEGAPFDASVAAGDDLAYVMYTSGSTGSPKGVAVSRANLAFSTDARRAVYGEAPKAFLLLSPFAFDSSVAGLYWTLRGGGTLVISEPLLEQDVSALSRTVAAHHVTHTLCLPSLHELVLEFAPAERLASLRTVIVAGEAVPPGLVGRHQDTLPGVRLFNEYGPTEATVWCTVAELTNEERHGPPPIGRPIPGAEVRLLTERQRLAPLGAVGEIWVGGPGVAQGYFRREAETGAAFRTLPFGAGPYYRTGDLARYGEDGRLAFLGRRDDQVKIRGHRIETGEIEAALRAHPAVHEACVLATPVAEGTAARSAGRRVLSAFVAVSGSDAPEAHALREFCRARVPAFMVPADVTVLNALPRLSNGKTDREALLRRAPPGASGHDVDAAPRDDVERQLAELWQEVLGVDRVGREDDFFALGGDSLASIRIVALARERGLSLAPSELFEFPTVAGLGRLQRRRSAPERASNRSPDPGAGAEPLYMVHGGQRLLEALQDCFGDEREVQVLTDHRDSGDVAPFARIESLAREYLDRIAEHRSTPPALLGGYSIGAPIAVEMGRQLEARGGEPPLVFLLDPPDDPAYFASAAGFAPAGPRPERSPRDPRQRADAARRSRLPRPLALLTAMAARALGRPVPLALRRHYVPWVYHRALRRHALRPYAGPLLIFHGADTIRDAEGRTLWERLSRGEVETARFHALHTEFVRDSGVIDAWTGRLSEALAAHERGAGPEDEQRKTHD